MKNTHHCSFIVLALILGCVCPGSAWSQIRVLSAGDVKSEWRKTQLAVLDQQLADKSLPEMVRKELTAQRRWLDTWRPGTLTDQPMWEPPKSAAQPLPEPIVDPDEKAGKLRQRLLGAKAKPTARDTQQLEKLLKDFPNDIGVRQLHLHWLDQKQYRKRYPVEIADAAIKLSTMLELAKPQSEAIKLARAHCLYRRTRALAYRELPDVLETLPITNREEYEAELLGAYEQLKELVGHRPEFILVDVRMKRRDGLYGQALELLTDHGKWIEKQWFLKKRRDLLRELGWEQPAKEAHDVYAAAFPDAVKAEAEGAPSNDVLD